MENLETKNKSVFEIVNYCFAISFALLPAIQVVLGIFVRETHFSLVYFIWAFIYLCIFGAFIPNHIKWLKKATTKSKLILITTCLAISLFFITIISAIVCKTFNTSTFFMLSYFFLFVCVIMLNKKQLSVFFDIMLASVCLVIVLNFIDPLGSWMPGLYSSDPVMWSSIFYHANYSAAVVSMLLVVCLNIMLFCKTKWKLCLYIFYSVIFSIFLFLNASFASITAVFFVLFVELIVLWIRNKKFPWQILVMILSFGAISLLLELIPNVHKYSTSPQNYFVELVAVFDNIFHTNLLQTWFHIETVPGADGWDRGTLVKNSLIAAIGGENATVAERIKAILFGVGSGSTEQYKPHNMFVSYWLESGLVASILHSIVIVLLLILMKKSNSSETSKHIRPFLFAAITYLFVTLFGSFKIYHYVYFVILIAIGIKISIIGKQESTE